MSAPFQFNGKLGTVRVKGHNGSATVVEGIIMLRLTQGKWCALSVRMSETELVNVPYGMKREGQEEITNQKICCYSKLEKEA